MRINDYFHRIDLAPESEKSDVNVIYLIRTIEDNFIEFLIEREDNWESYICYRISNTTADFVLFRPSGINWYRLGSTGAVSIVNFGLSGDKPVTGDFDGDGKSNAAIYRPSTGIHGIAVWSFN